MGEKERNSSPSVDCRKNVIDWDLFLKEVEAADAKDVFNFSGDLFRRKNNFNDNTVINNGESREVTSDNVLDWANLENTSDTVVASSELCIDANAVVSPTKRQQRSSHADAENNYGGAKSNNVQPLFSSTHSGSSDHRLQQSGVGRRSGFSFRGPINHHSIHIQPLSSSHFSAPLSSGTVDEHSIHGKFSPIPSSDQVRSNTSSCEQINHVAQRKQVEHGTTAANISSKVSSSRVSNTRQADCPPSQEERDTKFRHQYVNTGYLRGRRGNNRCYGRGSSGGHSKRGAFFPQNS